MSRTTKTVLQLAALAAACFPAASAHGHGRPIKVDAATGQLVVTGGTPDPNGFANQIFVQAGADGDLKGISSFGDFGTAVYWDVPGFEIKNMTVNSGLYLEALARPVSGTGPLEHRVLWYWNPTSGEIEDPPTEKFRIHKSDSQYIHLTPETTVAPPPVLVAAPAPADMNNHNHTLLKFLLPNPPPDAGVYAFFARLTSPSYLPSDPFLVLINNEFVSDADLLEGGLAINAAAVAGLPGDYNNDNVVDAADYTVWRNNLNDATEADIHNNGDRMNGVDEGDYSWWRKHYGTMSEGDGGLASTVPEPNAILLAVTAFLGLLMLTTGKITGIFPRPLRDFSVEPRRVCDTRRTINGQIFRSNFAIFASCFHDRRVTGRNRHHRLTDCLDVAGHSTGARVGAEVAVRQ